MIKCFWLGLSLAGIVWYLVVLGYVIVKGGVDIRDMLRRLASNSSDDNREESVHP